jgi:hypothetical protein
MFANREARQDSRAVLASVACVIRTTELAHSVITNPSVKATLFITNSSRAVDAGETIFTFTITVFQALSTTVTIARTRTLATIMTVKPKKTVTPSINTVSVEVATIGTLAGYRNGVYTTEFMISGAYQFTIKARKQNRSTCFRAYFPSTIYSNL